LRRDGLDGDGARQATIVVPQCGLAPTRLTSGSARPTMPLRASTASATLCSTRVAEPEAALRPPQCRRVSSSLPISHLKYRDQKHIKVRAPAHSSSPHEPHFKTNRLSRGSSGIFSAPCSQSAAASAARSTRHLPSRSRRVLHEHVHSSSSTIVPETRENL
jgi:hypothetical protein